MTDPVISTPRLTLRPWRETDLNAVLDIYGDPEVWRWLGANPEPVTDPGVALARINRWAGLFDGPCGIWAVVPDESELPVGSVLLLALPDATGAYTDDYEIGWHLARKAWGQGYATESAEAVISRAFAAGLPRVHAVVYEGNERSVGVTQRLGMVDEGVTDQWYGTTLRHFSLAAPN